ncbi:MAG: hypothetical protein Q9195_001708 [Heterodermia aff. obscurata]
MPTSSAPTLAGLNTINLSGINTFQQVVLFLLIILGSAIFVSIGVVQFRKAAFERRFKVIVEDARHRRRNRASTRRSPLSSTLPRVRSKNSSEVERQPSQTQIGSSSVHNQSSDAEDSNNATIQTSDEPAHELMERQTIAEKRPGTVPTMLDIRNEQDPPSEALRHRTTFFTANPSPSGRLHSPVITFQGIGARQDIMNHPMRVERRRDYTSPLRTAQSRERSNTGSTQRSDYPGVIGRNSQFSSLTFAEREHLGGAEYRAITLLAIVVPLYFILWQLLGALGLGAYVANNRSAAPEANGLNAWWVGAFNAISAFNNSGMSLLDANMIGNKSMASLPAGIRAIDGLFQALAVRSGGFYVVTIPELRIGLLILYVIMMYINVYPVVITMRNSNVYEERSLGIYADDPVASEQPDQKQSLIGKVRRRMTTQQTSTDSQGYFIQQQLRGQLAHDLWWIVLAVLFINIIETGSFERDPIHFSVFNYIFEIISAYGCVGISVGVPNDAYSFCGAWHSGSKLILCAVMIRGRHRGLPVAIDRAILLPGEHLNVAEEEDAMIRLEKSNSRPMGV